MKKFTTKLLMSIIAVAFAFVALGTSTYAWFSMNEKVTVTGMQISAKSDSSYLIIGTTDNVETLQGANEITVKLEVPTEDSKMFPSAHETIGNTAAAVAKTGTEYDNWYYSVAKTPNASDAKTDDNDQQIKNKLAEDKFDKYVIHKEVWVVLAKGSNNATNLVASLTSFQANNTANGTNETTSPVKVLITSATGAVELDGTTLSDNTKVLAATVTDQTAIKLDIYLYYNGADAAVYTNNVLNLEGASFTINFSVTLNSGN